MSGFSTMTSFILIKTRCSVVVFKLFILVAYVNRISFMIVSFVFYLFAELIFGFMNFRS